MSSANGAASKPVPLAIIGIGCLFPKAADARSYWINIKNGIDGIGPVPATHWNPEDYLDSDPKAPDRTYAARGGFLSPVDFRPLDFGIAPNDLEATDTSQLLGLVAAKNALLDAGYGSDRAFDRDRVSVILGVTGTLELVIPLGARLGHPRWKKALDNAGVSEEKSRQIIDEIGDSYVGWQENSFPGLLGNVVAGRIANRLDLGGTNCVVDAACASSLSAIHLAGLELASGRCDLAVTGGVDTFNDIFMYMCFSKTPALSPTGNAKPFDAAGDGTILGEGLGIVVLKRLTDAERDGDRIYAVIRGLGSSSDGKGNAIYAPSAAGQVKALRNAYELAEISPHTIELVEGHGTGTRVGDGVEVSALTEVYREAHGEGTWCALGSVKSQIGHTKAAAGAAGLIKAALALHHKVLPPTIKVSEPLDLVKPGKSPFYVNTEKRPWIARSEHPRRAAVSAFGFGGSNFHCVLEEYASGPESIDWDGDVEIIAVSAPDANKLSSKLEDWKGTRSWSEIRRAAAASRTGFSSADEARLLLVIQQRSTDLPRLIESVIGKLKTESAAHAWRLPEGAYFGRGAMHGKLAVLFPGQGSQYAGMLRDLACAFPAMRQVLADGNRVFARMTSGETSGRLSDAIYPYSAFSKQERDQQEQYLRRTEVAQPAIGAVSLGALKVLEQLGVRPDAYAGHSYGELPALCAAGCFDAESLHAISRLRGHLMASYRGADAGGMLAVHAPLATIESVLKEESLELTVANRNAPNQSVLSGPRAEIDRAIACFERRQVHQTPLAVSAAFHSPLVAAAQKPFGAALAKVRFAASDSPVFGNTSGQLYPRDPEAIREILAAQLACPVEFVREVGNMAADGVRTFLEVGPGSTLTKLVSSILAAPEQSEAVSNWDAFALDSSQGKRSGVLDLAHVLARLAARGHEVDLNLWQHEAHRPIEEERPRPSLVVPICGANFVPPKSKKAQQTAHRSPVASRPENSPTPRAKSMQEPTASAPANRVAASSANPEALNQALQVTQQSLAAFAQLQEQTAQLHRQFLENQEAAQRTLQMLVEQQHALLVGGPVRPVALPAPVKPLTPATPRLAARAFDPAPVDHNGDAHINGEYHPPAPSRSAPAKAVPVKPRVDATAVLLAVVAEKTGYPTEMLTPEMSLDADLGIDSIKRVEIFSALQERLPDAPVIKPEHLGTLQSLRDVISFLGADASPPAVPDRSPEPVVKAETPRGANRSDIAAVLFAVVAEKTGYPTEMLNAEMALDADLGIDSIKRVEIFSALQERLPDAPIVKPEHLGTLHSLGDVAKFLGGGSNGASAAPEVAKKKLVDADSPLAIEPDSNVFIERSVLRTKRLERSIAVETVTLPAGSMIVLVAENSDGTRALKQQIEGGAYRVRLVSWSEPPERVEVNAAGLILLAPAENAVADLPLRAFRWLRRFGASLVAAAEKGGAILSTITQLDGSFGLESGAGGESGALAGLLKTAGREWPKVACKALDLAPNLPPGHMTEVWREIRRRGPLEVGISAAGSVELSLADEPIETTTAAISASAIVLVTGGARGVTAAVAQVIAERCRPTLILIGRTDIDIAEPTWLTGCENEAAIKQALARHNVPTPPPKIIDAEYRQIVARRESLANIARMKKAGARVVYRAVDVTDAASVAASIAEWRSTLGTITHLIHGAGVLADRRIDDLTDEQFAHVYSTKVNGLKTILAALPSDSLQAMVLFSSSTGRFGRAGQAAYAAANEALNKIAQQQARARPECKVAAINWGPWDGGMVTPALRKLFESEGVGVIPVRRGAEALLRELLAAKSAVEVAVIARPTETAEIAREAPLLQDLAVINVSVGDYPVLRSHVIDGRAVLPLALHLEMLAHAALHGNPGLVFHGVNDLRILNGVQLGESEQAKLKLVAGAAVKREGAYLVPVELRGQRGDREVIHSRAEVLLVSRLPSAGKSQPIANLPPYPHTVAEAYRRILFHGSELAGIERVEGMSSTAIVASCRTAPPAASWIKQPLRGAWIADPLVLDTAFQMMILWSFAEKKAGCLPCFVGQYRQYRRSFPVGLVRIQVQVKQTTGSLVKADIEFVDAVGDVVAAIIDHESVSDGNLEQAFRRNRLG